MIIIIILKPYSGVNLEQGPDHEPGWSTWIDPKQSKNKNDYYQNFKN
jgi:hypothetical protein